MNQVNLVGRMVRDAEDIGGTASGVKFTVAVDDWNFSTKARETTFIPCVAFGKVVDTIKNYAEKGREVRVTGKFRTREYEAQKGIHAGHKVTDVSIFVDDFELLAGRPAGSNGGNVGPSTGPQDTGAGW